MLFVLARLFLLHLMAMPRCVIGFRTCFPLGFRLSPFAYAYADTLVLFADVVDDTVVVRARLHRSRAMNLSTFGNSSCSLSCLLIVLSRVCCGRERPYPCRRLWTSLTLDITASHLYTMYCFRPCTSLFFASYHPMLFNFIVLWVSDLVTSVHLSCFFAHVYCYSF
jgi:hypothetical protein